MAILMLTVMLPNQVLATLGDDEMRGDESIDECAQKVWPLLWPRKISEM